MPGTMILIVVVAVCILALAATLGGKRQRGLPPAFQKKAFLTANEQEFLQRLESAAPAYRFHAQVAMGALLDPAIERKSNAGDYQRMRNMFNQKIIDFVAQRRDTGEIVAIIELDDRTHQADKDARRDAMLQQAGYRTIRWQSKAKPNAAQIVAALAEPAQPAVTPAAATPPAPTAGNSVRAEIWGKAKASNVRPAA